MRTNIARNLLVILTAVVLSGCYSDGRWTAPNLAFWKSSPFQSAPLATPGSVGSPVRPSGIAAEQHNGSAGELRFDRRHHAARDHARHGRRLQCAYNAPGVSLSGGSIALRAYHEWRCPCDDTVELRAGLHGQHGGSARRKRVRNRIGPHLGHDWALWFCRRCRIAVWRHERLFQHVAIAVSPDARRSVLWDHQ